MWRRCGAARLTGQQDKSLVIRYIRRNCGSVAVWRANVGGRGVFLRGDPRTPRPSSDFHQDKGEISAATAPRKVARQNEGMNVDLDFEIGTMPDDPHSSPLAKLIASDRVAILQDIRADRAQRIADVAKQHGEQLDALLLLIAVGGDALNWAIDHINSTLGDDEEDKAFAEYYETLAVLAERAITTCAEIHQLLSVDFNSGARARLRTLEELFIVIVVLAVHGRPDGEHPELIKRYREHHRVFARSLAEELLSSGAMPDDHALDAETLLELERDRAELVTRYGKEYRSLWGWAAGLFPPRTQINFGKLSNLVDIDLAAFNSLASRHVHASSEGWHEAQEKSGESDFGYVAALGSGYLHMALQAVIPVSSTAPDQDVDSTGRDWHDALYALVLQVHGSTD